MKNLTENNKSHIEEGEKEDRKEGKGGRETKQRNEEKKIMYKKTGIMKKRRQIKKWK